MRKGSLVGVLLALLAALVVGCGSGAAPATALAQTGGGQLSVEPSAVEFGKVAYDQRVAPSWTLKNTGSTPVEIRDFKLDVVTGC